MELVSLAQTADTGEQFAAALAPEFIVGRTTLRFPATGEDKVGHLQIRHRPTVGRGIFIDLAGHAQRGLADFEGWPTIADDGRIDFPLVDHHRVVAHLGGVGLAGGEQVHRDDDEWIIFRDQETARLEVGNAALEIIDAITQPGFALGGGGRIGEFTLAIGEALFPTGHHRVGSGRALFPAVAGERLVVGGIDDGIRHHRQAVTIGAIGNHIHLGLHEEERFTLGRSQVEDGFAVVEVMLGEHLVERVGIAADAGDFVVIEFVKPR